MMSTIDRIGHVVLRVSDVDAAVDFYRDALGMEVVRHDPQRAMAFLSFGTQHHDIAVSADRGDGSRGSLGLAHIAMHMPGGDAELVAMHDRLVARGVPIKTTTDHGVSHSVYFTDPDGNGLEIFVDTMAPEDGIVEMRERGGGAIALDLAKIVR